MKKDLNRNLNQKNRPDPIIDANFPIKDGRRVQFEPKDEGESLNNEDLQLPNQ